MPPKNRKPAATIEAKPTLIGRRAQLSAYKNGMLSEWGLCWVETVGQSLRVSWLENGHPQHEFVKRSNVDNLQYLQ